MKPAKQTLFGPLNRFPKDGDSYVDKPKFERVPVCCGKEPMMGTSVRYYTRTPIKWMTLRDGKVVPR